MKLMAWRDDQDVADARLLLSRLSGNRDEVWRLIEVHLLPGRELKSKYAFSAMPNNVLDPLVDAILSYDALSARQWIADHRRKRTDWALIPEPLLYDALQMAVAAGVVELLCERDGRNPPQWTASVGRVEREVFFVHSAATMPRLHRLCREEGPSPLRRRYLFAPPEFLKTA